MVQHNYFGTARFYRRALSIALPVMAQLLIQNFVSLIDNFMVSGLGDIKMAGVNTAGKLNFLLFLFFQNIRLIRLLLNLNKYKKS